MREILTNHETVDRWWRTERGYVILLYLAQQLLCRKLLVVKHEHGCSRKPLSVKLTPHGLAPSRVGHGEVYAVFAEVMPEHTRGEMSESIEKIVSHHLGFATGSAGKIHQHGVVVGVDVVGAHKGRSVLPLLMPVVEPVGHLGTNRDKSVHRRTLAHGLAHLCEHILLAHTHYSPHACAVVAIHDVVLCEHVRGGYGDGTELMQGKHCKPPLITTFEDNHDHVAMSNAERGKVGCRLVAFAFDVGKRKKLFLTFVVGPDERHLVGLFLCPHVHHVVGEIKILGYVKMQIFPIILFRGKMGLRQESFYHL